MSVHPDIRTADALERIADALERIATTADGGEQAPKGGRSEPDQRRVTCPGCLEPLALVSVGTGEWSCNICGIHVGP